MKQVDKFHIHIETSIGPVEVEIVPCSTNDILYQAETEDLTETLEAAHQMREGSRYHYYFKDDKVQFNGQILSDIIFPSKATGHLGEGIIYTGLYVGNLTLDIILRDNPEEKIGEVNIEVQSIKMDYRKDYQTMLENITNEYVELILAQGSPANQYFEVDLENLHPHTLYQRFAFLRSIIESEEFSLAINKVIHNPVKRWTDTMVEKRISSVKRLSRQTLRQIAGRSNRIPISAEEHKDFNGLRSLPQSIEVPYMKDSIDIIENQFVKYVLLQFQQFIAQFSQLGKANQRLRNEATHTLQQVDQILSSVFFREISLPNIITLNSPVLQRKEGYREILQAWLFFDLAAKLTWKGGDNVYKAGKRNVAALYEYWLFFRLMRKSPWLRLSQRSRRS
ncbi:MAG: DUF2357 domain-containing protein, partial [Bacteroidales bacterium]|nr:DUF2357 domain-containing protein [Bacteroidales bacterium]